MLTISLNVDNVSICVYVLCMCLCSAIYSQKPHYLDNTRFIHFSLDLMKTKNPISLYTQATQ